MSTSIMHTIFTIYDLISVAIYVYWYTLTYKTVSTEYYQTSVNMNDYWTNDFIEVIKVWNTNKQNIEYERDTLILYLRQHDWLRLHNDDA